MSGRYLVTMNTRLSDYTQAQLLPIFHEIQDRVRSLPGVRMVSAALYAPMSRFAWHHEIRIVGKPDPGPEDDRASGWTRVMPGLRSTSAVAAADCTAGSVVFSLNCTISPSAVAANGPNS